MSDIQQALEQRILVIDGAMGTMIQRYKLSEADYRGERFKDWQSDLKGNNDLLCLTQPHIVKTIHQQYIEAGADIIETNTFNAQRISLADYHMESLAYELNVAAATIAKEAVAASGRQAWVAGAIGPMNKTLSLSPDVNNPGYRAMTFDEAVSAYYEQVKGLVDGGVDLLLIETIFDTLNAKAAIYAIKKYFQDTQKPELPISISGTINRNYFKEVGDSSETKKADLWSISGRFALNPRVQLIAFYQKNSINEQANYNVRLSWEYQPLSFIYLVYNSRAFQLPTQKRQTDDHVILKVSYLHQL